jgi:Putative zinc-finger
MIVMECEKFHDQIIEYSEGELGESARLSVEEHLNKCPQCARFLSDIGEIQESFAFEAPDPGQAYFKSLTNRVMTQVRASKEDTFIRRAVRWLTASLWRPTAALAPVAVAVAAALYILAGNSLLDEPISEDDINTIASLAEQYSPERMLGFAPVSLNEENTDFTDEQFDSMASFLYASPNDAEGVAEVPDAYNAVSNIDPAAGVYSSGYSELSEDEVDKLHEHLVKTMDAWVI